MSSASKNVALVIIPTYNEIDNVERMVETVLSLPRDFNVLIVDDNSPDGTGRKVTERFGSNERVAMIEREGKLGLGTAYVAGFKYALENGYDYVMEMDCDFSHDPLDLVRLLDAAADYDLVIGSRYVQGRVNVVNWPLSRLLLSLGASLYTRIITGMPLRDPTSGFKCYRRAVLESIDLDNIDSNGYSFQIEMHYKTWKKRFRIKEIPITFTDRVDGVSKMGGGIVREAIYVVWELRLPKIFPRRKKTTGQTA